MKKCRSSQLLKFNNYFKKQQDCISQECITIPETDPVGDQAQYLLKNKILCLQKQTLTAMHSIQIQIRQKSQRLGELKSKIQLIKKKAQQERIDRKILIEEYKNTAKYMINKYLDANELQLNLMGNIFELKMSETRKKLAKQIEKRQRAVKIMNYLLHEKQSEKKALEICRRKNILDKNLSYLVTQVKEVQQNFRKQITILQKKWMQKINELNQQIIQMETIILQDLKKQSSVRQSNKQHLLELFQNLSHQCVQKK